MKKISILLFSILIISCRQKIEFRPVKNAHIIIMGNTFAERMQYFPWFEAALHKNFPADSLVIRNLGWSGDEPYLQPRPLNFGSVHEHLAHQKADVIFLCFGMNESFKGKDSIAAYKANLTRYCGELLDHKYNDRSAPQLILVSPIAHENVGGSYPDGVEHNKSLALYTDAMKDVAGQMKIGFIDLFQPSLKKTKEKNHKLITIDGIHLTDSGYSDAAGWMSEALGLTYDRTSLSPLIKFSVIKNQHFFYRWRAVNGEYIYGRRKEPFGVISFPPEMKKLDKMVAALDKEIWSAANDPANAEKYENEVISIVDESQKNPSEEQIALHDLPATTAQFTVPKGYKVSLFASEKDFPVEKPVAMNFDAKGRLWVATMPTYPQYFPGYPARDKIIILEDTDNDGKADKHTVFADSLYLPLGFLFGNNGVYVAEEPNILFLEDTDGDGKADRKEILLQGFGSEDSHHATHAFTWGQDGAMYFHEGTFHNSQVETPYGPMRATYGATFRYEPRTGKLSNYISYSYNNPWGNVFDKWGMHLIGDASDGNNYYATPLTAKIDYPGKHPHMDIFTATKVRPTAGIEIVSSRHFPDDVQGNFLVNNTIGFQGIKQHKLTYSGSGVSGVEVENLLQSSDPNFRPVDLKFGPDGALYIADWFNPLIGHMQFSLRDPGRDKSHGRIWKITYPSRPLLKVRDISKQSVPELLDNLKEYEDRFRFRTREQLRTKKRAEVIPALKAWMGALDKRSPEYEHLQLEGLWIYQDFDVVNEELLKTLLNAKNFRARAAATRVLFYWRDRVPNSVRLMAERAKDDSARVRIEAVVGLGYFNSDTAAIAAAGVLKMPMDYYLNYATRETLRYMRPLWQKGAEEFSAAAKWLDSIQAVEDKEHEKKEAQEMKKEESIFKVSTLLSKMLFDKKEIILPAYSDVTIRFSNPDEMPHNFVIIKQGAVEKVGKAADAMAARKDGFQKNFIPDLAEVLFATPLVEPKKSYDLEVKTKGPGQFEFICSFPGHWNMMKGIIKVVKK